MFSIEISAFQRNCACSRTENIRVQCPVEPASEQNRLWNNRTRLYYDIGDSEL